MYFISPDFFMLLLLVIWFNLTIIIKYDQLSAVKITGTTRWSSLSYISIAQALETLPVHSFTRS